jgi:hypothetical protein
MIPGVDSVDEFRVIRRLIIVQYRFFAVKFIQASPARTQPFEAADDLRMIIYRSPLPVAYSIIRGAAPP